MPTFNLGTEGLEACSVIHIHNISLDTVEHLIREAKLDENSEALTAMGADLKDKVLMCQYTIGESGEPLLVVGYGPKSLARDLAPHP